MLNAMMPTKLCDENNFVDNSRSNALIKAKSIVGSETVVEIDTATLCTKRAAAVALKDVIQNQVSDLRTDLHESLAKPIVFDVGMTSKRDASFVALFAEEHELTMLLDQIGAFDIEIKRSTKDMLEQTRIHKLSDAGREKYVKLATHRNKLIKQCASAADENDAVCRDWQNVVAEYRTVSAELSALRTTDSERESRIALLTDQTATLTDEERLELNVLGTKMTASEREARAAELDGRLSDLDAKKNELDSKRTALCRKVESYTAEVSRKDVEVDRLLEATEAKCKAKTHEPMPTLQVASDGPITCDTNASNNGASDVDEDSDADVDDKIVQSYDNDDDYDTQKKRKRRVAIEKCASVAQAKNNRARTTFEGVGGVFAGEHDDGCEVSKTLILFPFFSVFFAHRILFRHHSTCCKYSSR